MNQTPKDPTPTNGHLWRKLDVLATPSTPWRMITACQLCGVVRRADDLNKACMGEASLNAPHPLSTRITPVVKTTRFKIS